MNTSTSIPEVNAFPGLPPQYYPARLSETELAMLREVWAGYARQGATASPSLGAYLHALCSLECERRAALEEGCQVLDVEMPAMATHLWSNVELAAALDKLSAMAFSTSGEIQVLFQKLFGCALVEVQYRLGFRNPK